MATAMKSRQATQHKATCKGVIWYMTNDFGKWEDEASWTYANPAQRLEAIRSAEVMYDEGHGRRRIVDAHRDEHQRQHYGIVAEMGDPEPEPPSDFYAGVVEVEPEDSEALRQFLADETGLAWRVYNYQGVDYTPPSLQ